MNSTSVSVRWSLWLLTIYLVSMAGAAAAADKRVIPVELGKVQSQRGEAQRWTPGTVISRQSANLAPEISGRLEWLVEVGDHVRAGESIARINDTALQIQLRTDEADIRRLEASEEFSRRQVERFRTLSDANSMAAAELDRLTMELRMLEQERAAREARRDATLHNIAVTTVTAPFNGLIVERYAEVGEYARAGEPVLHIVNIRELEVRARAPVNIARYLRPGQTVLLEVDSDRVETTVTAMVPSGGERGRMIEVRTEIPAGDWIVGEAVRIALPNSYSAQRLAIPRDALVLRDAEVYVFKVLDDFTVERIAVRPGKGTGNMITVEGELAVNDAVVIRGAETLQDGQLIRVVGQNAVAEAAVNVFEKG